MTAIHPKLAAGEDRLSWTPLLELAAQEVFVLMLGGNLAPAPDPFPENELDVAAIVGLAGQISGAIALRCTPQSATRMAAKMLGAASGEAGPEVSDAVGEICNMIAGNFKNKVPGMGDGCVLSVPIVITGTDYSLHSLACSARVEICLLFEKLPLIVSITVHS